MHPVYETLSEAVNDLRQRGYQDEFRFSEDKDCLLRQADDQEVLAEEFEIDEVHRVKGGPDLNSALFVYALRSEASAAKGIFTEDEMRVQTGKSKVISRFRQYSEMADIQYMQMTALQPISREHYHVLRFCWKIRMGLSRKIERERIHAYIQYFWQSYVKPHFEMEEAHIFPALGNAHPMVERAINEHRQIENMINRGLKHETEFGLLETLLERHVRFEERVLFPEMQLLLLPEVLERVATVHRDSEWHSEWSDDFWH